MSYQISGKDSEDFIADPHFYIAVLSRLKKEIDSYKHPRSEDASKITKETIDMINKIVEIWYKLDDILEQTNIKRVWNAIEAVENDDAGKIEIEYALKNLKY